jgi:hypothetical protein
MGDELDASVRSVRSADIAVGQALFVAVIAAFSLRIRTGPELQDALADAFSFVGLDISALHGDAPWLVVVAPFAISGVPDYIIINLDF